ncbi:sugar kinase [Jannaschia ovalis]|uniref:Sugar kinase n=1 Tax=Jannaschia ovalis TaxID=3038773 RepID=A0ABY8L769_9RHOB|nr:sugar kinase [Jannaschia sp. GRR-S6-38]WGH77230.1 sugar kinase [Jannaschia sp. GRR-S6-38]
MTAAAPPRAPRILSIGECMVELAPAGPDGLFRRGFAGDTMNTAWYLARLRPDWAVGYLSAVGQDTISDAMLAFMAQAGIATEHVARRADRTVGLYLIELRDGERSFAYWRDRSAARRLAEDADALDRAFAGTDLIYLSGITLAVLKGDGRARLLDRLAAARAGGARIAFDPNLRPRLWPGTAAMCAAVTEAAGLADIVLPSHDDEATHFGDVDPAATRDRYAALGAGTVVVKDGPGDILAVSDGMRAGLRPDPVARVVDTTAAGDSFNAGFLAAHLAGESLDAALRAGAALSARVIGGRGALVEI